MRKSIFDKIYEQYPNNFPEKPSLEERKKIYDRAFTFCSREYELEFDLKPARVDIQKCLESKIIELLELYQQYRKAKNEYEVRQLQKGKKGTFGEYKNRQHSENCRCEICNPPFEPISDKDIREMEEDEKTAKLERESFVINESLKEAFSAQFCPICKCNPCRCEN